MLPMLMIYLPGGRAVTVWSPTRGFRLCAGPHVCWSSCRVPNRSFSSLATPICLTMLDASTNLEVYTTAANWSAYFSRPAAGSDSDN